MPLRLALIKPNPPQAEPKPRQNSPENIGDFLHDPPSSPMPIQDEPTLARAPDVHADLRTVITAWPTLSEDIQAAILLLIQGDEVRR